MHSREIKKEEKRGKGRKCTLCHFFHLQCIFLLSKYIFHQSVSNSFSPSDRRESLSYYLVPHSTWYLNCVWVMLLEALHFLSSASAMARGSHSLSPEEAMSLAPLSKCWERSDRIKMRIYHYYCHLHFFILLLSPKRLAICWPLVEHKSSQPKNVKYKNPLQKWKFMAGSSGFYIFDFFRAECRNKNCLLFPHSAHFFPQPYHSLACPIFYQGNQCVRGNVDKKMYIFSPVLFYFSDVISWCIYYKTKKYICRLF